MCVDFARPARTGRQTREPSLWARSEVVKRNTLASCNKHNGKGEALVLSVWLQGDEVGEAGVRVARADHLYDLKPH